MGRVEQGRGWLGQGGKTVLAAIIVIVVIVAIVVLLVLFMAGMYNGLIRSRVRVNEAWSGIDVQLKRRNSLIPNLVETVKGYAAHEREVFERVTEARSAVERAGGAKEATDANNMMTQALSHLFAVAENYPQLRASENFMALQNELTDTEEKIAFARQFYNRNVMDFNTRILVFPAVFMARMMNLQPFDFFGTEEEARQDVKVSFSATPPA